MESYALTPDVLELVAERFKALAEPARLQILEALREGESTVTALVERTGLGQANLSKHLRLLHQVGYVDRRKDGVYVRYSLADGQVLELCELMCGRLASEAEARQAILEASPRE